jgi:predicted permease
VSARSASFSSPLDHLTCDFSLPENSSQNSAVPCMGKLAGILNIVDSRTTLGFVSPSLAKSLMIFLLSGAGGAAGLLLASAAIQWLIHERLDMMRVQAIHIDGFEIACTAGLIVLCAFFAGLVSAFNARCDQALSTLQSSRSHSAGGESVQMRTALLSLQVAVTVVLLIVAGLLLKSYDKPLSAGLGCSTTNVLKMGLQLPKAQYGDPASVERLAFREQRNRFFESLLREVRSLPGIQAAGLIYGGVPGEGYGPDNGFTIVEHPELPPDQRPYAILRWVDPGYFAAMGIPLRSGHTFDDNQRLGHATEVIVSESFARKYFAEEDAVGRHIRITDSRSYEIVAVVGDARFAPGEPARPIMYSELLVDPQESSTTLVIRSGPDALQSSMPVQSVIWKLDPDLPVSNVLTMDQVVSGNTLNASFDASLLSAFAGLSLLLAGAGLFGVLSYIVAQRTSEIGIRIALGARREQLLRLILMDGLRPAFVGLALGSAVSAGITQLIRSTLYDSTALDLPVFAAVAVLLLWVAALACLIPAWRASRLDPMQALRSE